MFVRMGIVYDDFELWEFLVVLDCSAGGRVNERRRPTTASAGSNKRETCHEKRRRERKTSKDLARRWRSRKELRGGVAWTPDLSVSIRGNLVSKRCLMFSL